MSGKVTYDLAQRSVGSFGLLWNRLTPTRGTKSVSETIGHLALKGDIKVSVRENALNINDGEKEIALYSSLAYAKCLFKAGVKGIQITQGTEPKAIKELLDILSETRFDGIKRLFENNSIIVENENIGALCSPFTWRDYTALMGPTDKLIKPISPSYYKNLALAGAVAGGIISAAIQQPPTSTLLGYAHVFLGAGVAFGSVLLVDAVFYGINLIGRANFYAKRYMQYLSFKASMRAFLQYPEKYLDVVLHSLVQAAKANQNFRIVDAVKGKVDPAKLQRLFLGNLNLIRQTVDCLGSKQLSMLAEEKTEETLILLQAIKRDKLFPREKAMQIIRSKAISPVVFQYAVENIDSLIDSLSIEDLKFLIGVGNNDGKLAAIASCPNVPVEAVVLLLKNNYSVRGEGVGEIVGWDKEGYYENVGSTETNYHSTGGAAFSDQSSNESVYHSSSGPIYESYKFVYPVRQAAAKNLMAHLNTLTTEKRIEVEKALSEAVFEEIK